jgi:hypothetical protein
MAQFPGGYQLIGHFGAPKGLRAGRRLTRSWRDCVEIEDEKLFIARTSPAIPEAARDLACAMRGRGWQTGQERGQKWFLALHACQHAVMRKPESRQIVRAARTRVADRIKAIGAGGVR